MKKYKTNFNVEMEITIPDELCPLDVQRFVHQFIKRTLSHTSDKGGMVSMKFVEISDEKLKYLEYSSKSYKRKERLK